MRQSLATKATYWLKVVSLGMVLGLGLQFAQAWVAPAAAPPGGNVSGPVTVGTAAQYKTGKLGVNSNIAPISAFEVGNGGDVLIGGKVYSASTVAVDSGNTLATKDYVDGKAGGGTIILKNQLNTVFAGHKTVKAPQSACAWGGLEPWIEVAQDGSVWVKYLNGQYSYMCFNINNTLRGDCPSDTFGIAEISEEKVVFGCGTSNSGAAHLFWEE